MNGSERILKDSYGHTAWPLIIACGIQHGIPFSHRETIAAWPVQSSPEPEGGN